MNHSPVVVFTTHEGTRDTVLSLDGIPAAASSLGREITMYYAPTGPAVCTPDLAADRRSNARAVGTIVLMFAVGTTAAVSGLALL